MNTFHIHFYYIRCYLTGYYQILLQGIWEWCAETVRRKEARKKSEAKARAKAKAKAEKKAAWHRIKWGDVRRSIRKLQARIVKAIKAGKMGKVKALQWLLTHAYYAKLLAIRKVTSNKGHNTPGIDGKVWRSAKQKMQAVEVLKRHSYRAQALKRVKIAKGKGKWRKLGIPTIADRAMQALHALALDPVSETLADRHSYGYRKDRSAQDAIGQLFIIYAQKNAATWALEADIKGCFDHIDHDWLLANIPMDKGILRKFLKSGVQVGGVTKATESGTPQGGIISPILANMTLDGLEHAIDEALGIRTIIDKEGTARKRNNPYQVHIVRYADDFIISANDPNVLIQTVKPVIEAFLQERGLHLSERKTKISQLKDGYHFLGQDIRKYNDKLLIKPSKDSIKKLLNKVRGIIKKYGGNSAYQMVISINSVLRGWANYHRHVCSKQTFARVDYHVFNALYKWCKRRHSNKSSSWIVKKYFKASEKDKWHFKVQAKDNQYPLELYKISQTKIVRHIKIRGAANPYDPKDEMYFEKRHTYLMKRDFEGRYKLNVLFCRQKGCCTRCGQPITKQTEWHKHHIIPKYQGGSDHLSNLELLHPICHRQIHVEMSAKEKLNCCA